MKFYAIVLSLLSLAPTLATYQCPHGKPQRGSNLEETVEEPWTTNKKLEQSFVKDEPAPYITPARVSVDLDLPPYERWLEIGKSYASQSDLIIQYFEELLPKPLVKIIDKLAAKLITYPGFGTYGEEMRGYADGLGLDIGYVVAANLVYEMEHIGVTCDNWNNTGPTGQCDGEDPEQVVWLSSNHFLENQESQIKSGGYCTSVVAESSSSSDDLLSTSVKKIIHGRNLDWNLDVNVRSLIVTVDYHRSGIPLYSGSSIISFVDY